jgi:hypothetical protein
MSIWVATPETWIGFSNNLIWSTYGEYHTVESDGDTKKQMEAYGWGLIAPSALNKWDS